MAFSILVVAAIKRKEGMRERYVKNKIKQNKEYMLEKDQWES